MWLFGERMLGGINPVFSGPSLAIDAIPLKLRAGHSLRRFACHVLELTELSPN